MTMSLKLRGMNYLRRRDISTDRDNTHAYIRMALLVLVVVILWTVIIAAAVTIYTTLF
jgi:hypothetical protein